MKLIEAYEVLRASSSKASEFSVFLGCGFNPQHLSTFLSAHLQLSAQSCRPQITTGLFGDCFGNIQRLASSTREAGVAVIEWCDLDPRLGIRSAGSWLPEVLPDIVDNVEQRCYGLWQALRRAAQDATLVVSFPSLPLPPVSFGTQWEASSFEAALKAIVAELARQLAADANIKIVNQDYLDQISLTKDRLNIDSELTAGIPYTLAHSDALAEIISKLIIPPTGKKGLITDLDDTLWRGLAGEIGSDAVSWDLDHGTHMHALYQKVLQSLSATGILIGVASKNDPHVAEQVFHRTDILLSRSAIFPMEVSWDPKSRSISRILKLWNVSADSVVFIDDSPIELAEVKAAHPGIECLRFPRSNNEGLQLLQRLRNLFGKTAILNEDLLRTPSMVRQQQAKTLDESDPLSISAIIQAAEPELTITFDKEPNDARPLELINKTNQFNLNGRRYTSTAWKKYLNSPDVFLIVIAYSDKYGSLGKISVVAGRHAPPQLLIDVWVMSCRAFSRDIEHQCLAELFDRFVVEELILDFVVTERNGPFRAFLETVTGSQPMAPCRITRDDFLARRHPTAHRIREAATSL